MLYKNEDAFSKAYKENRWNLFLLYGGESYLIDAWARRILNGRGGEDRAGGSFNFQKLDGRRTDIDALIDATEALPFGASEKTVLLDGLDTSRLTADDLGTLEELLSDLNPACVLVITGREPAFDKNSAAGKRIVKLCGEHGAAAELGARGAAGLTAFIKAAVKKHGCEISTDICRYILQVCDNSMHSLGNETAKICAYAGGGVVTRAHVDAVASAKTEARVFDLARCVLSGNAQRAYEILSNLFYLRESPVAILSALSMSYVDFYRARAAKDESVTAAEMGKLFGYKSEYRVNNAFSAKLSAAALKRSLECLFDCDRKMKSTGADDRILLEKAVAELFLARGLS